MYVPGGPTKEARTKTFELVDRVGGEAVDLGGLTSILRNRGCRPAVDKKSGSLGSGLGGVDYGNATGRRAFDQGAQQRVVGAAQDKRIGAHSRGGGIARKLAQVDANHCVGDVVIDPTFFDERNEKRAGLLIGA